MFRLWDVGVCIMTSLSLQLVAEMIPYCQQADLFFSHPLLFSLLI